MLSKRLTKRLADVERETSSMAHALTTATLAEIVEDISADLKSSGISQTERLVMNAQRRALRAELSRRADVATTHA